MVNDKFLHIAALILGVVLFSSAAVFLGAAATGAGSIPALVILWLFVPAPLVFGWFWWQTNRGIPPRHKKVVITYLVASLVLSMLVAVGVGWIGSERGIHPAPCETGSAQLSEYPSLEPLAEVVAFPVPELGQRKGWFIPGDKHSTIILLHGYGCRRQEMLDRALALNQAGYSTLLFDFYGRGDSDGNAVTLGFYERADVLAAVDYLKTRDDVDLSNLGVLGISMGASVAITAAAEAPEIKAVVADSPFESATKAVEEGFTRVTGLPRFLFGPITLQFIQWRLGISPRDVAPAEHVSAISPRPLLLIHGESDSEVSPGNSESLYASAGEPKELVLLSGVEHTRGMKDRPTEYTDLVVGFFNRYLD